MANSVERAEPICPITTPFPPGLTRCTQPFLQRCRQGQSSPDSIEAISLGKILKGPHLQKWGAPTERPAPLHPLRLDHKESEIKAENQIWFPPLPSSAASGEFPSLSEP